MNSLVPTGPVRRFTNQEMAIIRRSCALQATDDEFDNFMAMCQGRGLDPRMKHAYCIVYNADKPDKRTVAFIVSVGGQRFLASQCVDRHGESIYRADDKEPRFEYDEKLIDPESNPKGLVKAVVSVFKYSHGEWHETPGVARWDERAPLSEIWAYDNEAGRKAPTGKFKLQKGEWRKQGEHMLAKSAEMDALRKAFPDQFGGLYIREEMDRGDVIDITPSQMVTEAAKQKRMEKVGRGEGETLIMDLMDGTDRLSIVALRDVHATLDKVLAGMSSEPKTIRSFFERNRVALEQFWAIDKDAFLDLKKKHLDGAVKALMEAEKAQASDGGEGQN